MLKTLIEKRLESVEKKYDYNMDYARRVLEAGATVYKRFYEATQLGAYEGGLPAAVRAAAQIVSIKEGDCGPCTQLTVQLAEEAGVSAEEIEALVAGRFDDLPEDVSLAARFSWALLRRDASLPKLREQVLSRFGLEGQVALAYAIITMGMYPTLKYAIGFGESCGDVVVGGREVRVAQFSGPGAMSGAA